MFFKQERAEMDDFVRAEKPWLQRKMFLFKKKSLNGYLYKKMARNICIYSLISEHSKLFFVLEKNCIF